MKTYRRPLALSTLVFATLLSAGCVMLPPPLCPQPGQAMQGMPPPPPPFGDEPMPPPHGHRGPPPEFLAACKDQSEGAKVQLTTPRNDTISGTCERGPEGAPLMFRPEPRTRP